MESPSGNTTLVNVTAAPASETLLTGHEDDKFASKLSTAEDLISGLILFVTGVVSLVLNMSVMIVGYRRRRTLLATDVYVLNVALCDLVMVLIMWPMVIPSYLTHGWLFGNTGCQVYGFMGFFLGLSSIYSVSVMSVGRYIKICTSGQLAQKFLEPAMIKVQLFFIYLISLVFSVTPLLGWGKYGVELHGTSCSLAWAELDRQQGYVTTIFVFTYFLPICVMVASYLAIYFKTKNSQAADTSTKELRVLKMSAVICVVFILEWGPYSAVAIWTAYGDAETIPIQVTALPVMAYKCLIVLNPLMYFLPLKHHRKQVMRLWGCRNTQVQAEGSAMASTEPSHIATSVRHLTIRGLPEEPSSSGNMTKRRPRVTLSPPKELYPFKQVLPPDTTKPEPRPESLLV